MHYDSIQQLLFSFSYLSWFITAIGLVFLQQRYKNRARNAAKNPSKTLYDGSSITNDGAESG